MSEILSPHTASSSLLEQLANERRKVLSDWRAFVLLRRATLVLAPSERRWERAPASIRDVHPILRRMVQRGELQPIRGLRQIYEVTVPYARFTHVEEQEILTDIHPYAALSHISALTFHRLSNQLPNEVVVTAPTGEVSGMYPVGTTAEDWIGLDLVPGRRVKAILGTPIHWVNVKPERYFGIGQYRPAGYTILATTPERTLLDGLQAPQLCGGLEHVLEAWALASDTLNVDVLVQLVEQFDVNVLRQRAGFLLETLNLSHAALDRWQRLAGRGGSSKLLASAPYSSDFSERWNLSLNAPIDALRG